MFCLYSSGREMSNTVKYGLVITIFWVAFKCPPGALSTVRWAPKASTCPLKAIPAGDGGWEGGEEPSPLMPLPQVQQAGPSLKATAPSPTPSRQLLQLPLETQLPLGALPSLPRPSRPSTAGTGRLFYSLLISLKPAHILVLNGS